MSEILESVINDLHGSYVKKTFPPNGYLNPKSSRGVIEHDDFQVVIHFNDTNYTTDSPYRVILKLNCDLRQKIGIYPKSKFKYFLFRLKKKPVVKRFSLHLTNELEEAIFENKLLNDLFSSHSILMFSRLVNERTEIVLIPNESVLEKIILQELISLITEIGYVCVRFNIKSNFLS